jgi:hypothetical protein
MPLPRIPKLALVVAAASSCAAELPGMAGLRPWAVLPFDVARWAPLLEHAAAQARCEPAALGRLHLFDDATAPLPRKNRQRTQGRRADPVALDALVAAYEAFVCEVVAPHVADAFDGPCDALYFQAMPSLRISPPAAAPAGRRHRDADYGHQPGQVNFWLPLAPAFGANTLWVEGLRADEPATPLEGGFGTLHRFHGHALTHATRPNDTGATRVSLDFRVIPGPVYDDDWAGSRAAGGDGDEAAHAGGAQRFFLGGYYSRARREDARAPWRICGSGGGRLRGNAARMAAAAGGVAEELSPYAIVEYSQ